MQGFKESLARARTSLVFQSALATALIVPLAAALGQFGNTGYLWGESRFLILFWPGTEWEWAPRLPVWLTMGVMGVSYLAGIAYLLRRKTLGAVVLWAIAILIGAKLAAFGVNSLAGWQETQNINTMPLTGKVNGLIFATWQNPLWEEVVFRGLPLLVLLRLTPRGESISKWYRWSYVIVPNVFLALYHVPEHGYARLTDTLLIGCAFSWLTLRYTFFAPLVMHYVFDAMIVISLAKVPNIPAGEVTWLAEQSGVLNTSWSLAMLTALISFPVVVLLARPLRRGDADDLIAAPLGTSLPGASASEMEIATRNRREH